MSNEREINGLTRLLRATRFQLVFCLSKAQIDALPAEFLAQGHIKVNRDRGIVYIDYALDDTKDHSVPELDYTVIRDLNVEITPIIVASEYGAYSTRDNHGFGQTVCGGSGRALPPFYLCDEVGRDHALFSTRCAVIICHASKKTDQRWMLKVWEVRFSYDVTTNILKVDVRQFWGGSRFNEAPRRYQTALVFAMAKATTVTCSGGAYYEPRGQRDQDQEQDANISNDDDTTDCEGEQVITLADE